MQARPIWIWSIPSSIICLGSPASAQDVPGAGSGEIIVTARKRQESILKVPVVANVIGAETLQQASITDIKSVATKIPGLSVSPGINSIGTLISLRGVGTSALDAGIDQSVSLNIDGQQFSQGLAFSSGLFDLVQAEVLKGPQALFFGKNSPAGVIALTTADPQDYVEVIGRASYEFEAREPRAELILSGPLSDTFGLRLAGSWSDRKGYFKNMAGLSARPDLGGLPPAHKRSDANKNWIIRGTAAWEPSTQFKARLKVNLTRDHSDSPNPIQYLSCPNGTGPSVVGIPFIGGPRNCKLDRETSVVDMSPAAFPGIRNNGTPFLTIRQRFGVLDLNYHITPEILASSTTTYYRNKTDGLINGTSTGAAASLSADNGFYRRDITQEIRIQSDRNTPLNWLIGGYYQDANMKNDILVGWNQLANPAIVPIFGFGLPAILAAGTHEVNIKSKSLFGQLRWRPIESVEIAGGIRWTHERRTNHPTTRNGLTGVYDRVSQPAISSENWSPELTITYTPTDDLTIFGALKQGYKSGSYQILIPVNPGEDKSFGDEKVQGGEVGLKARLRDRSLNFNAAFYYYRFEGLQIGVAEASDAALVPIVRTLNAGKSRTYGIDLDATYRPPSLDGLSFNLAVNWNKAKFLELDALPCIGGQTIAAGCNQVLNPVTGLFTARDESGTPLERAPEWQLIGGFDYETSLTEKLGMAFGSSIQYSSSFTTPIGRRPDFRQSSYAKLNAYVTLKGNDDRWELSLIGNNLNDVIRCGYCANSDFQNTAVLTGLAQTTGGVTNIGPLGVGTVDQVGGIAIPGRQVLLKLTLRPIGLFQ